MKKREKTLVFKRGSVRVLTMLLAVMSFVSMQSCIKEEPLNMEADIVEVSIENIAQEMLNGQPLIQGSQITLYIKEEVDVDALSAVQLHFTTTPGATVVPGSGSVFDLSTGEPVLVVVTSEDGQYSKEYAIIVTNKPFDLTNPFSFDTEISIGVNPDYPANYMEFYEKNNQRPNVWATANIGLSLTLMGTPNLQPSDYPTYAVDNTVDAHPGARTVVLQTLSTGPLGAMFGAPIAPGNLFLGVFDVENALGLGDAKLKATHFGVPVNKIPTHLEGSYKYTPGAQFTDATLTPIAGREDLCDIYAVFFDRELVSQHNGGVQDWLDATDGANNIFNSSSVIAVARLGEGGTTQGQFVDFSLPFEYKIDPETISEEDLASGRYSLAVVFSSSKDGDHFNGAIGSELRVGNVRVSTK